MRVGIIKAHPIHDHSGPPGPGPGIDDYVLLDVETGADSGEYFYHTDGLGSVTDVTTRAGSTLNTRYEYAPFGSATVDDTYNALASENPYGYTGRRLDGESGLMYYRSRYYSPEQRRFVGEDRWDGILSLPDSYIDKYVFVNNSPINLVDPFGYQGNGSVFRSAEYFHNGGQSNIFSGLERFSSWVRNPFLFIHAYSTILDKDFHYNRNTLIACNEPSYEEAIKKWRESSKFFSRYHRHGNGNDGNRRFVSPDGHCEAIFTKDGTPVTDDANMASYNYGTTKIDHVLWDVIPYWMWGNTPNDPTPSFNRIYGL